MDKQLGRIFCSAPQLLSGMLIFLFSWCRLSGLEPDKPVHVVIQAADRPPMVGLARIEFMARYTVHKGIGSAHAAADDKGVSRRLGIAALHQSELTAVSEHRPPAAEDLRDHVEGHTVLHGHPLGAGLN